MKEYSYNCNDYVVGTTDSKHIKSKANSINSPGYAKPSVYINPVHINSVEKRLF